jgi:hypothetical protein
MDLDRDVMSLLQDRPRPSPGHGQPQAIIPEFLSAILCFEIDATLRYMRPDRTLAHGYDYRKGEHVYMIPMRDTKKKKGEA